MKIQIETLIRLLDEEVLCPADRDQHNQLKSCNFMPDRSADVQACNKCPLWNRNSVKETITELKGVVDTVKTNKLLGVTNEDGG